MPHFHFLKVLHISKIIHNSKLFPEAIRGKAENDKHTCYIPFTHTSLLIKPSAFLDLLFSQTVSSIFLPAIKGN